MMSCFLDNSLVVNKLSTGCMKTPANMTMNEETPLLGDGKHTKNGRHFSVPNRVLVAGLLIATALGITQVPYV
jgi:hypothetical protein